jgi:hypothetical protein
VVKFEVVGCDLGFFPDGAGVHLKRERSRKD